MEEIKKAEPAESIEISIKIIEDGSLKIDGKVINNEPLALWMLDKAKDLIKGHNLNNFLKEQSKVIKPKGGLMNFARGIRR